MTKRLTRGVHHIGLTVPDLDQARDFFCGLLGFDEVGGVESYPSIFVSDGAILVTLWRAADPLTARAFDRRAISGFIISRWPWSMMRPLRRLGRSDPGRRRGISWCSFSAGSGSSSPRRSPDQ